MALDLTGEPQPTFASQTGAGTTCTEIRGHPHTTVAIYATGAIYAFNGVAEGAAAPGATLRKAYTATQAAQGVLLTLGGSVAGQTYGTVCVAAQTGTVDLEAHSVPPERVAP